MHYYFNNYHFDSEQLLLYLNNKLVPIKENEAKLLVLLLSDPNKIFNKNIILSIVWKNKVVSDQAVFQSISNLRSVFGNNAIETFTKKGYQWKLIFEYEPQDHLYNPPKTVRNINILILAIASLILLIGLGINYLNNENVDKFSEIHFSSIAMLPLLSKDNADFKITANEAEKFQELILKTDNLQILNYSSNIPSIVSYYSPQSFLKKVLSDTGAELTLVVKISALEDKFSLGFKLSNISRVWQGVIEGNSINELSYKLIAHLQVVTNRELFEVQEPNKQLYKAKLHQLNRKYTDDLIIQHHLVKSLFIDGDFSNTVLSATHLLSKAKQSRNSHYQGVAQLEIARAMINQDYIADANSQLLQALALAEQNNDLSLQSDITKEMSFISNIKLDYESTKQHLLQTANFALGAEEKLKEIEAYTLLSIIAHKNKQENDKLYYINEAERLLDKYDLHKEHYAIVYYHEGLFSKQKSQSEYHFRRLLNLPYTEKNSWIIESTQQALTELLLKENRIDDIVNLFSTGKTLSSNESYLLAKAFYQDGNIEQAKLLATKAFQESDFSNEKQIALNLALLLMKIANKENSTYEQNLFEQYIEKEADNYWLKTNEMAIKQLKSNTR